MLKHFWRSSVYSITTQAFNTTDVLWLHWSHVILYNTWCRQSPKTSVQTHKMQLLLHGGSCQHGLWTGETGRQEKKNPRTIKVILALPYMQLLDRPNIWMWMGYFWMLELCSASGERVVQLTIEKDLLYGSNSFSFLIIKHCMKGVYFRIGLFKMLNIYVAATKHTIFL